MCEDCRHVLFDVRKLVKANQAFTPLATQSIIGRRFGLRSGMYVDVGRLLGEVDYSVQALGGHDEYIRGNQASYLQSAARAS